MTRNPDLPSGDPSRIYQATNLVAAYSSPLAGSEIAVITRTSPIRTGDNEDAAAVVELPEQGAILAVADGFGGAPAGERAAAIAIAGITAAAEEARQDGRSLRAAVLDGFETANRNILELGIGAATTLAVVGIEEGIARPFHSGDSAILIFGGRGKIKFQSVSHSPAGYAVASGWVDESDAREHDEAQVVSNYLGSPEMRIEVGPEIALAQRDVVLVASDGLTDNLSVDEIRDGLTGSRRLTDALDELTDRARARMDTSDGKPDDLTVVAFRGVLTKG